MVGLEQPERQRTEEERERYRELLEELRTLIPGAQVLLAFLLTVPFAARFAEVDQLGKAVFSVSLIASTAAVVLFFAPAAYHRLADRTDRVGRLRYGVRLAMVAISLVGVSIAAAVFVVIRFMFDDTVTAVVLSGTTGALATVTWVVVPMTHRRQRHGTSESQLGQ